MLCKKKIGQSGGASRWRVCYQRGLPRLVDLVYKVLRIVIQLTLVRIEFPEESGKTKSFKEPSSIISLATLAGPFLGLIDGTEDLFNLRNCFRKSSKFVAVTNETR